MWYRCRVIAYGRFVRMLGGLSRRSAALDAGIGVVALAFSLVFGRHAALSQPGTRLIAYLGYTLTFGMHDSTIMARSLIGVIALPILLLAQLPVLARRRAS